MLTINNIKPFAPPLPWHHRTMSYPFLSPPQPQFFPAFGHLQRHLEAGFLPPRWQIPPCLTAERWRKMAAIERRTCTTILRNWLQSEGNCGWFRTCCTFKETAPLRFLVYLTGALISGCFCTCPLNLSEWRFQPCTLLSNWKNVFFEWPHLPLSPHNRILLSGTTGIRSYGDM